ncbi:hypothetical protein CANARDRAFT_29758 [[Candida] arabinofermentans NRRL YB-2248]|uniref:malate dehydrogenase n=1 Tax=[Candida] arabinofermentans NRRL YB-2248 TaxID=983967 RepID=A0A1E4SW88_9ASCO|nr:hypothetical protein CANARDRAFT_29758 [[Candida] arabinofermentans NRRL YB-2248]
MVKATVLGAAGGIGQPLSLLLRLNPIITELSLYDIVNSVGVATDLSHIPTSQKVTGYSPSDKNDQTQLAEALKGSDIVVIPAGIPRKPGMTRDDLFKINASIVKGLVNQVGLTCPNAFLCIISNPVNSTVPIAVEQLKKLKVYNPKKVFGITTLDNLRLEQFLSDTVAGSIAPKDLFSDVITIGGHSGETIVPIINSWAKGLLDTEYEKLIHRVQFGGDEVVQAKNGAGSATLSMATAAYRFVSNLLQALSTNNTIKEVAFINLVPSLNGYDYNVPNGVKDEVEYFSLPLKIDRDGIKLVEFPPNLSPKEEELVTIAISKLKADITKGVNFVHGPKL